MSVLWAQRETNRDEYLERHEAASLGLHGRVLCAFWPPTLSSPVTVHMDLPALIVGQISSSLSFSVWLSDDADSGLCVLATFNFGLLSSTGAAPGSGRYAFTELRPGFKRQRLSSSSKTRLIARVRLDLARPSGLLRHFYECGIIKYRLSRARPSLDPLEQFQPRNVHVIFAPPSYRTFEP